MAKKVKTKKVKKSKKNFLVSLIFALVGFWLAWYLLNGFGIFNPEWKVPPVKKSVNGVLDVTLRAQHSEVNVGGKMMATDNYNGMYPSETWEVNKGDKINVHLINDLDQPTNLHFHGSHVSPKGHSDNVLLKIKPGESFDYSYDLAINPPGMYWYHPHFHPDVEGQVMGGMAGAIMVHGDEDALPGIKDVPQRVMVLTTVDGKDFDRPERLVNGQKNPTMYLRPGQTVRLEILNASADDPYSFAIPGHKLNVISRDGNTLNKVVQTDSEDMPPGRRIQILFTPKEAGVIPVKSLYKNTGFTQYAEVTFMNIKVGGFAMKPVPLPAKLLPHEDLRNAKVDRVRTLTFSEGGTEENTTFLIDGKQVNMDEVSQIMDLGTVEEWHLKNTSMEPHPFHIHINPFQVISINGKPTDMHGYVDTFGIPANGEFVMRTRFRDFDGKFVIHCHILFHEDHGMMQVVEVVKPGEPLSGDNGLPELEMKHEDMTEMMNVKKQSGYENRRHIPSVTPVMNHMSDMQM